MAYRLEDNKDIVIDGWGNGIAESPYKGLSDLRGQNIVPIPDETSVNFTTSSIAPPTFSNGAVTSADTGTDVITFTGASNIEARMCIYFTSVTGLTGVSTNTPYWVGNISGSTCKLYTHPSSDPADLVNITANGTGSFRTYNMAQPKHFTYDWVNNAYWMIDSQGQVWFNAYTTGTTNAWVFSGNTGGTGLGNGNGIVFYQAVDISNTANNVPYIFVFRNSRIDYTVSTNSTYAWNYSWNPATGTTNQNTDVLTTPNGTNNPHHAIVAQNSKLYWTDGSYVDCLYPTSATTPLNPATTSSYTFQTGKVLPQPIMLQHSDTAICLGMLGTNLLIGASQNILYSWDFTSAFPKYIYLAERGVYGIQTVNTNAYLFTGNRGRIYITNGSQAQLVKKVPDHLSGTTEPYYTWGGSCTLKNQIYFGITATKNDGTAIPEYGGLWAYDVDTESLRITNRMSYGTYAGGVKALIAVGTPSPTGLGLFAGWSDGAVTYGIDTTLSTPYTDYVARIDTDMLPIGTYLQKRTFEWVEFKLATPMVAGEGIKISYRKTLADSFTLIGETLYSATEDTNLSNAMNVNFENCQWIQLRIEMKSTVNTPSFVRLREIRIR